MAEIGLIASVIQVAGAGLKLSQTLYQYADGVATADRRIKDIAKEIQLTSFVVEELGAVFKHDETSTLMSANAIKTAHATMKECSSVFAEIDATLQKSKKNTLGRLMLPFRDNKIELLRNHIDKLKSTLQLLMQVLTHAHQIAAKKLDREAEAKQKAQIQELIDLKKKSAKKYEESLKNFSISDGGSTLINDDDDDDNPAAANKYQQDSQPTRDLAVTASAIGSSISPKTLETCVQHVRSLLEDIENLQQALSDQVEDHSEHHQSLIGSYFRARGHLDKILFSGSQGESTTTGMVQISETHVQVESIEVETGQDEISKMQSAGQLRNLDGFSGAKRISPVLSRRATLEPIPGVRPDIQVALGRRTSIDSVEEEEREKDLRLQAPSRRATLTPSPGVRPSIRITRGRRMSPDSSDEERAEKMRESRGNSTALLSEQDESETEVRGRPRPTEELADAGIRSVWTATGTAVAHRQLPIEFRDTSGKVYKIPFKIGQSWQGLYERIKRAHAHTNKWSDRVSKGQFDLLDEDRHVILPEDYDEMIEPGMTISMQFWSRADSDTESGAGESSIHDESASAPGSRHATPMSSRRGFMTMTRAESDEQPRLPTTELERMESEHCTADIRDRNAKAALLMQQQEDPAYYSTRTGGMSSTPSRHARRNSQWPRGSYSSEVRPTLSRTNSSRRTNIVQSTPAPIGQGSYQSPPSTRTRVPPPVLFDTTGVRPPSARRPSFSSQGSPFARGSAGSIVQPTSPQKRSRSTENSGIETILPKSERHIHHTQKSSKSQAEEQHSRWQRENLPSSLPPPPQYPSNQEQSVVESSSFQPRTGKPHRGKESEHLKRRSAEEEIQEEEENTKQVRFDMGRPEYLAKERSGHALARKESRRAANREEARVRERLVENMNPQATGSDSDGPPRANRRSAYLSDDSINLDSVSDQGNLSIRSLSSASEKAVRSRPSKQSDRTDDDDSVVQTKLQNTSAWASEAVLRHGRSQLDVLKEEGSVIPGDAETTSRVVDEKRGLNADTSARLPVKQKEAREPPGAVWSSPDIKPRLSDRIPFSAQPNRNSRDGYNSVKFGGLSRQMDSSLRSNDGLESLREHMRASSVNGSIGGRDSAPGIQTPKMIMAERKKKEEMRAVREEGRRRFEGNLGNFDPPSSLDEQPAIEVGSVATAKNDRAAMDTKVGSGGSTIPIARSGYHAATISFPTPEKEGNKAQEQTSDDVTSLQDSCNGGNDKTDNKRPIVDSALAGVATDQIVRHHRKRGSDLGAANVMTLDKYSDRDRSRSESLDRGLHRRHRSRSRDRNKSSSGSRSSERGRSRSASEPALVEYGGDPIYTERATGTQSNEDDLSTESLDDGPDQFIRPKPSKLEHEVTKEPLDETHGQGDFLVDPIDWSTADGTSRSGGINIDAMTGPTNYDDFWTDWRYNGTDPDHLISPGEDVGPPPESIFQHMSARKQAPRPRVDISPAYTYPVIPVEVQTNQTSPLVDQQNFVDYSASSTLFTNSYVGGNRDTTSGSATRTATDTKNQWLESISDAPDPNKRESDDLSEKEVRRQAEEIEREKDHHEMLKERRMRQNAGRDRVNQMIGTNREKSDQATKTALVLVEACRWRSKTLASPSGAKDESIAPVARARNDILIDRPLLWLSDAHRRIPKKMHTAGIEPESISDHRPKETFTSEDENRPKCTMVRKSIKGLSIGPAEVNADPADQDAMDVVPNWSLAAGTDSSEADQWDPEPEPVLELESPPVAEEKSSDRWDDWGEAAVSSKKSKKKKGKRGTTAVFPNPIEEEPVVGPEPEPVGDPEPEPLKGAEKNEGGEWGFSSVWGGSKKKKKGDNGLAGEKSSDDAATDKDTTENLMGEDNGGEEDIDEVDALLKDWTTVY